ncbi:M10 family metallopeptidase C-terminal domain-containing protein [Pseudomonas sp. SDO5271_S396]
MFIPFRAFTPFLPILQPFIRPFISHPVFRPFIQPFISPPFVRPLVQPTAERFKRDISADQPAERNWDGRDITLRPDDPHITKANRRSFDEEGAIRQLSPSRTKWQDHNGDGKTSIAYSFRNGGFNPEQQRQARLTMQSWADVANLEFSEGNGRGEGRLSFGISRGVRSAHGYGPTGSNPGATVYNPDRVTRHDMAHEIGHSLGLAHPGHYDGWANDNARVYAQDSVAHTVMSYFDAEASGKQCGRGWSKPAAPMMDDIAAIQRLYGINKQTRNGDTTYGFNSNTERDFLSLKSHQDRAFFCVWDGGGNDTLDFSGYHANQTINLRAGSFSDVGGLEGNVSIARGVTLENAIGGKGNDALIGNEANNRLTGGGGADRLRGGGGADTFIYEQASDSTPDKPDTLMDFTSGTDKIDVSGAMQRANTSTLTFTQALSGKAGESVLAFDASTGRGSLSIDLTGNGQADLLIHTHGEVKAEDIIQAKPAYMRPQSSYRLKRHWWA